MFGEMIVENSSGSVYKLRLMGDEHLDLVLGWRNHPEVRRYMYTQHLISMEEHQAWFKRACADDAKCLLIFEKLGKPIGFLNFSLQGKGRVADWGFYMDPDHQKGDGRHLGLEGLRYGFDNLKLHKICGQALEYNNASIGFHEYLGFVQEGCLRSHAFDGKEYNSVICFGLLAEEWASDKVKV